MSELVGANNVTDQALLLRGIQTLAVHGETVRIDVVKAVQLSMTVDWGFGDGALSFRFVSSCALLDAELPDGVIAADSPERNLGSISGTVVVQYVTPDEMARPEGDDWYRNFVGSRVLADVTPYFRELIASTAVRIGFSNITIESFPTQD